MIHPTVASGHRGWQRELAAHSGSWPPALLTRLVPQLAKALGVPTPAVRKPGSAWTEPPRPVSAGAEPLGHVRLGHARASTARHSLDAQLDSLADAGVPRVLSEEISTRATRRPELEGAVKLAGEIRSSGVAVTHEQAATAAGA
ncbi:hypothetical protein [Streptomyces sp. MMG1121]|uniref:hypothetical protein n=1 Tax=Streptomyces sp. MMG1121 TaxID=1415544 RepID=UPI000B2B7AC4|nr:hypothetical protein [Streptomyces sp. MMG1121]